MEYLQLFDKNFKPLNKKILRGDKNILHNEYIKVVVVWIRNSENKYLVQKTSNRKGSINALTGGHVGFNQTGIDAMAREINEELGLKVNKKELINIGVYIQNNQVLFETYILQKNIELDSLNLQTLEVESVDWKTLSDIKQLAKEDKFKNTHFKTLELLEKYLHSLDIKN